MFKHLLVSLPLSMALFGCTTDNPGYIDAYANCPSGTTSVRQQFPLADPGVVDILFVVDNGPGMASYQERLAAAIPSFVDALDAAGLDWRAGVTSTDMVTEGQQGALQIGTSAGCDGSTAMIEDGDEGAAAHLACNIMLGETGPNFSQGIRAAIHGAAADGPNPGFSRDGARLVIFTFAAHDDCSLPRAGGFDTSSANNCVWQAENLEAVPELMGLLRQQARDGDIQLAGEPISFVAINAPRDGRTYAAPTAPAPACSAPAPAFAGNRYQEAIETTGVKGSTHSICASSYGDMLIDAVMEAVDITDDAVCMDQPMVGDPNLVRLIDRLGEDGAEVLVLGGGDFLNLGATDTCPNGAVAVATDAHSHLSTHIAEVFFCTQ